MAAALVVVVVVVPAAAALVVAAVAARFEEGLPSDSALLGGSARRAGAFTCGAVSPISQVAGNI